MTYTISLISLQCLVSQEDNGDEIYLTLNGEKIWSVPRRYAMHEQPNRPHHIKEVNFIAGSFLTQQGWQPMPDFEPIEYQFTGLSGKSEIQVWDQDNFSRDDYFGHMLITDSDAGRGHITGVAANDAARYVLTYEVVSEPEV